MRRRQLLLFAGIAALGACAHPRRAIELPQVQWLSIPMTVAEKETYAAVPSADEDRLGCHSAGTRSPICSIGFPNSEEDSAFHAEAVRLASHPSWRCRNLSATILRNLPQVRMYPQALVSQVSNVRYYGVGHSYRSDRVWQIRIARRLTELNVRTLDQKVRTFRHEMAHTLGASEEPTLEWSAEEYADRCG